MRFLPKYTYQLALFVCISYLWSSRILADAPMPTVVPTEKQNMNTNLAQLRTQAERMVHSYKPVYLAYGNPLTKIQFSFMSQLSNAVPLNFAYTQIIFWKLLEDSKPFGDATYNPELFYRWQTKATKWNAIDFGVWEHNSNGKSDSASRSYDQSYIRAVYGQETGNWVFLVSPKLRIIYNLDDTNQDIRKYLSPFELDLRSIYLMENVLEQSEFIVSLRPGGEYADHWQRGGYQLAANFRIVGWGINPAFYIQYYHGYAETLINYNEKVDQVRVGLMF